ncbi:MAG: DUF934 domain-containing protein [Pseudomonadota bacterium]
MPQLIKDGAVTQSTWLDPAPDASIAPAGHFATLAQWQASDAKAGLPVQLEPGDDTSTLLQDLNALSLVAVHFPLLTDGRGFSYARELRERGYMGELRARGHFMRDQLTYLTRVGFNSFEFAQDTDLEAALSSLQDFTEFYQAAPDQPLPLFRRRA